MRRVSTVRFVVAVVGVVLATSLGTPVSARPAQAAPVPAPPSLLDMGGTSNHLGTGALLGASGTGRAAEGFSLSVNPYCTDKLNGDRYQSGYTGGTCSGTANPEYRSTGYTYAIDVPAERSSALDLLLWDARYSEDKLEYTVPGPDTCTSSYVYPTSPTTDWTGPAVGTTTLVTVRGPLQYQTATSSGAWNAIVTLGDGATMTTRRDRLRYRSPAHTWPTSTATGWTEVSASGASVTILGLAQYQTRSSTTDAWTSVPADLAVGEATTGAGNLLRLRRPDYSPAPPVCTPTTLTNTEAPIDDERQTGDEPYTFTLFAADATPADPSDNPVLCTRTFVATTPFELSFLGSRRWNRMPCSIAPSAPAGRYLLRVTNAGGPGPSTVPEADGSNQFGLVAAYADAGTDAAAVLCDAAIDPRCPQVSGVGTLSLRADSDRPTARIPLGRVPAAEAGRRLVVRLFDPGEGGQAIRLLAPTGPGAWSAVPFLWRADDGTQGSGSSLDVQYNRFNGKEVELVADLGGYVPPSGNDVWKIEYAFSGAVTDRSTWDAAVVDAVPSTISGTVSAPSALDGTEVWLVRDGDAWLSRTTTVVPTSPTSATFALTGVPMGTYRLVVVPPTGSGLAARWIGGPGTDRAQATALRVRGGGAGVTAPATTLLPVTVLSGRVSDGTDGVAGATVRIFASGDGWVPAHLVTTGPDGTWTVTGPAAGSYQVQVLPPDGRGLAMRWYQASASRSGSTPVVVVPAGAITDVDVSLPAVGTLAGRVTGTGGTPVADARVVLFGAADTWVGSFEGRTGADGSYVVTGVGPGAYRVRFVPPASSGLVATWWGDVRRPTSVPVTVDPAGAVVGIDQQLHG